MDNYYVEMNLIRARSRAKVKRIKVEEKRKLELIYTKIKARNDHIVALHLRGELGYGRIAKRFGISSSRVQQVISKYKKGSKKCA